MTVERSIGWSHLTFAEQFGARRVRALETVGGAATVYARKAPK
jgi:hypothetical protein